MNHPSTVLKLLFSSSIIVQNSFPALSREQQEKRPNILLILTDDQGYGDLRCHGNEKVSTPVLDKLASQSLRFDRFMVCPYSSFSRASLLTGRYPLRTGVLSVTRGLEFARPEEVTIAEVLKKADYATGCFGKWHIGEHFPSTPNGQGFDEFFGIPQGHANFYFDPQLNHNGKQVQTKGFITDILTDSTLSFIEKHQSEPFFCYVPFNAPHSPFQVPDRYFDKYTAMGLDGRNASIYGMVENVDENIGRLLAKLDELSLSENTIVIFLTDNGAEGDVGSRYNAGMRGMKGSVHEGGMRVPFFIRWPGKIKPKTVDRIGAHVDLLPTIAELCGIKKLKTLPLDGRSLVPLFDGSEPNWPDRLIFARSAGWKKMVEYKDSLITNIEPYGGTVRTQRWRAVNEGKGWQLYDMQNDRSESKDLAKTFPDTLSKLSNAYDEWFVDVTKKPISRPLIPVGYKGHPDVELPAPEAFFTKGISWYNKYGFAYDWLTGWKSKDDLIWWNINVVKSGYYNVSIDYTCSDAAVGTKLQVKAGKSVTESNLMNSYNPEPLMRPRRENTVWYTQTFKNQSLGKLYLKKGNQRVSIQALTNKVSPICELKSILLQKVEK